MIHTSTKINAALGRMSNHCGEVGRSSPHVWTTLYPYKELLMDELTKNDSAGETLTSATKDNHSEITTAPTEAQAYKEMPTGETESQAAPASQDSAQPNAKAEHGTTVASPAKATKSRKPKKVRTLTRQRIDEIAAEMAEHAGAGHFTDNLIPVSLVAEHFNITVALVERIFIQAFSEHGLAGYKLDYGTDGTGKGADECYIDDRGMILIGKSIIESFNSKPDLGCKFEKGDKFTVTCSENEIILTIKQ